MTILVSRIQIQSEQFKVNTAMMTEAVEEFRQIERRVIDAADAKTARYIKRGLLPPRERLSLSLIPIRLLRRRR